MTDEASMEGKWRKQQIRMHALEMSINSGMKGPTTTKLIERAVMFEDYIFRSGDALTDPQFPDGFESHEEG